MSETLALETQLLLQEVTQAKQFEVAATVPDQVNDAGELLAPPPVSEFEAAKQSLVEKLRKKKEQNRQQQQQLFVKRYGFAAPATDTKHETPAAKAPAPPARLTPTKAKRMVRLPVTASSATGPRQKKDLLSKLRTQAIKQGAQEMAKLFGYKSYEEQIKELNKKEKKIIMESAMAEALAAKKKDEVVDLGKDEDSSSDFVAEADEGHDHEMEEDEGSEHAQEREDDDVVMDGEDAVSAPVSARPDTQESEGVADQYEHEETQDLEALEAASRHSAVAVSKPTSLNGDAEKSTSSPSAARRRRNHITLDEEEDGNEADSEEDGRHDEEEDEADEPQEKTPRDKAAAFRQMLQAEAKQERKRKRLRNGDNFVESEADEDDEEDVLKIGGLGDFGFGVPQAASKEAKDAEDERNALKMREDDLEGIVDDLSDDERNQAQDLDEIYRRELEEQDRQQVKEVMRNVKEGFGRNRRAFSSLDGGMGARGRFNLNQLVAADGDKMEAARLGLLESDEDQSDKDDDEDADESKGGEEEEEEDEEAEMERLLRERFVNQPKIYITSSESENEEENEVENDGDEAAKEEIESDEERERQQMKLFSERARINRRMQRMKDMQRQIAEEVQEEGAQKAPMPNLLLEEDDDSQSLLKVLTRTDVTQKPTDIILSVDKSIGRAAAARPKSTTAGPSRSKVGRFNTFGMGSAVRSTSSFSRVADNCKLFSTGSGTASATKGFVFTSFSSDRTDQADENAASSVEDPKVADAPTSSAVGLTKNMNRTGGSSTRQAKRPFAASNGAASSANGSKSKKPKSDFFSVLASYQCVSQSSSSQQ